MPQSTPTSSLVILPADTDIEGTTKVLSVGETVPIVTKPIDATKPVESTKPSLWDISTVLEKSLRDSIRLSIGHPAVDIEVERNSINKKHKFVDLIIDHIFNLRSHLTFASECGLVAQSLEATSSPTNRKLLLQIQHPEGFMNRERDHPIDSQEGP